MKYSVYITKVFCLNDESECLNPKIGAQIVQYLHLRFSEHILFRE